MIPHKLVTKRNFDLDIKNLFDYYYHHGDTETIILPDLETLLKKIGFELDLCRLYSDIIKVPLTQNEVLEITYQKNPFIHKWFSFNYDFDTESGNLQRCNWIYYGQFSQESQTKYNISRCFALQICIRSIDRFYINYDLQIVIHNPSSSYCMINKIIFKKSFGVGTDIMNKLRKETRKTISLVDHSIILDELIQRFNQIFIQYEKS